jgi:hypothetical protein
MRRLGSILLLAATLCSVSMSIAAAGSYFVIRPVEVPYRNVGIEVFNEQFNLDVDSPVAGDQLYVEFTTHMPDGWFAQFCQVSTGICYFASHAVTLPSSGKDRIQVDFFMNQGMEETGYVDLKIYRVADPTTFQEITYAIGHGIAMPTSRFTFTSANVFQQTDPNSTVQFSSTIRSFDNFNDHLIVTVTSDMPPGWFAQFCQVSTGVCYFGNAVIPFPALATDELQVDFFCFNPDPAIGNFRLRLQSEANPAMWTSISFRVRAGDIPADVSDATSLGFSAAIAPNPVHNDAELRVDLTRPTGVQFRIVDITGRTVYARELSSLPAGSHRIAWDGKDGLGRPLSSGTYFYRVTGGSDQVEGKFTIDR